MKKIFASIIAISLCVNGALIVHLANKVGELNQTVAKVDVSLGSSAEIGAWNSYATSSSVTVGASSVMVAATTSSRTFLQLFNNATSSIFCNVKNGAPATALSGITINASSSAIISDVDTRPYRGAVFCINPSSAPIGVGVIEK